MNKYFLLFTLFAFSAIAQDDSTAYVKYKKIKIEGHCGITGGTTWRDKDNILAHTGLGFYIHPIYPVNKSINIGLKIEYMGIDKFYSDVDNSTLIPKGKNYEVQGTPITSMALTIDYNYRLNDSKVFIGIGAGTFQLGSGSINFNQGIAKFYMGRTIGAEGYAGIQIKKFIISAGANLISERNKPLQNREYATFRIGYEIGGKRQTTKK